MTDWKSAKELFQRARELPPEEREELLRWVAADDPELAAEVRALLAQDEEDEFLVPPGEPGEENAEIPGRLGSIRIEECIGRGGMGVVYRGYDTDLERTVAVKCMSRPVDAQHRERFLREAKAVARLRHPGIVSIHSVKADQGFPYFTMDFLEGPDLRVEIERLRSGASGVHVPAHASAAYVTAVAALCAHVAEALQYAHEQGVIHRDVKPSNLIFGADRFLLVDFGLAYVRDADRITNPDLVQGTPQYMSPEQARLFGGPEIDHRTDIYSLGVVLYELLTLRLPFPGKTPQEIFFQVAELEPTSPRKLNPAVSSDLATVCATAMAKAPAQRYLTAGGFAEDLRRVVAGRPTLARPPSLLARTLQGLRRHRVAVGFLATAVVAVAGGFQVRRSLERRKTHPVLAIEVRDRENRVLPDVAGEVFLRSIHPTTGEVGERVSLGRLPLGRRRIPPGGCRVIVVFADGGFCELTRTFEATGGSHVLRAFLPPGPEPARGMVSFVGGTWSTEDGELSLCPNRGVAVRLAPFALDPCETSNAEYRRFLLATEREPPPRWTALDWRDESLRVVDRQGREQEWGRLPVVGITWAESQAYAEWYGKRLPTHAEWELAARGQQRRLFPWGDGASPRYLGNCDGERNEYNTQAASYELYLRNASPVDSHPEAASPEGLFHLLGNVMEFTETPTVARRDGDLRPDPLWRYILGSAWDAQPRERTLALHEINRIDETGASNQYGIRCAKSIEP